MYGGSNSVMTPNVWTFWPLSYQGCFVVVLTSAVRKKNALLGGLDFAQWSSKDPSHIFYILMHSELKKNKKWNFMKVILFAPMAKIKGYFEIFPN